MIFAHGNFITYSVTIKTEMNLSLYDLALIVKCALVIAQFGVQYGEYFPSLSHFFFSLFREPIGERNSSKN